MDSNIVVNLDEMVVEDLVLPRADEPEFEESRLESAPRPFPWRALAILAACLYGGLTRSSPRAQTPPPLERSLPAKTIHQAVRELTIPLCHGTMREVLGDDPAITLVGNERYQLSWYSSKYAVGKELRFEYDRRLKQLRPLDPYARSLLDMNGPCARER